MGSRIEALCAGFPESADAAIISSPVNRFYFTGMRSSDGTLIVTRGGKSYFIIDSRYYEAAKKIAGKECEVLLQDKLYEQITKIMKRHEVRQAAVEDDYMTLAGFARLKRGLSCVRLMQESKLSKTASRLRAVKSGDELENIERAQRITDDAFEHICGYIRPGRTEREVAAELLDYTFRHGSQGPSFDYIVVSGANSSMPHGVPTEKKIERGDFVTMDFGCLYGGYCSDMTRTVAVGEADEHMREVYDIVLRAQENALAAIKPGVACKSVDAAARSVIDQSGYKGCFGHGTGHSLGIEIHESPAFNTRDETALEPGMVLSVEPGIYLEGRFGVRIEDIMVVTPQGCKNLTRADKKLRCL